MRQKQNRPPLSQGHSTQLDLEFVEPDLFNELLPVKESPPENGKFPGVLLHPERRGYIQAAAEREEAIFKAVPEGAPRFVVPGLGFPYELSFEKKLSVKSQKISPLHR